MNPVRIIDAAIAFFNAHEAVAAPVPHVSLSIAFGSRGTSSPVGQFSTKLNAQFLICELLLEDAPFLRLGVKFVVTAPRIQEFVTKAGVKNMWNMLEQRAAGSDQYTAELDRMLDMILHVDAVPADHPYRSLLTARIQQYIAEYRVAAEAETRIQQYIAEYRVAAEAETSMARFTLSAADINHRADLWINNVITAGRIDLDVPFALKHKVAKLGGFWDSAMKVWWCRPELIRSFNRFLPISVAPFYSKLLLRIPSALKKTKSVRQGPIDAFFR